MSRANVDDVVFFTSFASRLAAIGALGYAIFKLGRSMYDELKFEADWTYPGDRS